MCEVDMQDEKIQKEGDIGRHRNAIETVLEQGMQGHYKADVQGQCEELDTHREQRIAKL
jgi:hypothetical protein